MVYLDDKLNVIFCHELAGEICLGFSLSIDF